MDNGKLATREHILAIHDRRVERVEVPEWGAGCYVYVRSMTAKEKSDYNAQTVKRLSNGEYDVDLTDAAVKLVVRVLCDADGQRLFHDDEYALLRDKNAAAIERIAEAGRRMSAFTKEEVDLLAKNSASGRSDGSSSG